MFAWKDCLLCASRPRVWGGLEGASLRRSFRLMERAVQHRRGQGGGGGGDKTTGVDPDANPWARIHPSGQYKPSE